MPTIMFMIAAWANLKLASELEDRLRTEQLKMQQADLKRKASKSASENE